MSLQIQAPARRVRGFSLIELMVVVAIGAILFAIAVPSYMSYIRQARRTDAKTALLDLAAREERWLTTNPAGYTNSAANLGYTGAFPVTLTNGYYQLQVCVAAAGAALGGCDPNPNPPPGPSFYLTATPVAGSSQVNDSQCTSFSVDSLGAQFATGTQTSAYCWAN
jgi:type IV pilus assembly protein PilE